MIIIKFKGGLGNQMFQYAFYRNLQLSNPKRTVIMDLTYFKKTNHKEFELTEAFGIMPNEAKKNTHKIIVYFLNSKILQVYLRLFGNLPFYIRDEKNLLEGININPILSCFEGYFISESYFFSNRLLIINDFRTKMIPTGSIYNNFLNQIKTCNSVCLHIRLGDYVKSDIHNVIQNQSYYVKSINYLNKLEKDIRIFIFSDDITQAKIFYFNKEATYINSEDFVDSHYEFTLMTNCKHFVISNSTFSWWAAYLRRDAKGITIAPSKWFLSKDYNQEKIYIKNWVVIDV